MPTIKLQSSDGETFPVEVDIARQSVTIRTMLEDLGTHFFTWKSNNFESSFFDPLYFHEKCPRQFSFFKTKVQRVYYRLNCWHENFLKGEKYENQGRKSVEKLRSFRLSEITKN